MLVPFDMKVEEVAEKVFSVNGLYVRYTDEYPVPAERATYRVYVLGQRGPVVDGKPDYDCYFGIMTIKDTQEKLVSAFTGLTEKNPRTPQKPRVILSSPLAFAGGVYKSEEVAFPEDLSGMVSYVGHPATKALLEALGAETVPGRWEGPKVGESYLAVPLERNEREGGYTKDTAVDGVKDLKSILITRIG